MGRRAEFEEKSFESAFNGELSRRGCWVFSPGQVLEGHLGFDAAIHIDPNLWNILQVRARDGLRFQDALAMRWHGMAERTLPKHLVSTFFQYKRPTFEDSQRAAHRGYWQSSYFQFTISSQQHGRLRELEDTVRSHAVVRYASPAFWRFEDLYERMEASEVVQSTTFARPKRISVGHRRWTYSGPGTRGCANPDPEETDAEDWSALSAVLAQRSERQTLAAHIFSVAQQVRAVYGERRGRRGFPPLPTGLSYDRLTDMPPQSRSKLLDFLMVVDAANWCGAVWRIVAVDNIRWPASGLQSVKF